MIEIGTKFNCEFIRHGTVGLKSQRVNSQYSFVPKIKSARRNETCGVEYFLYAY